MIGYVLWTPLLLVGYFIVLGNMAQISILPYLIKPIWARDTHYTHQNTRTVDPGNWLNLMPLLP
jgi:hypothetical protein